MNRAAPDAPPGIALTVVETHLLDVLLRNRRGAEASPAVLSSYLI